VNGLRQIWNGGGVGDFSIEVGHFQDFAVVGCPFVLIFSTKSSRRESRKGGQLVASDEVTRDERGFWEKSSKPTIFHFGKTPPKLEKLIKRLLTLVGTGFFIQKSGLQKNDVKSTIDYNLSGEVWDTGRHEH
jgi:hypothetical protein